MKVERNNKGFSLTEVLMAIGILAVGTIFVAGTFPVAIRFSAIATERTIAAVVADEAFAKIKLIAADPNYSASDFDYMVSFQEKVNEIRGVGGYDPIDPDEFAYPSTGSVAQKRYYWSALCRRVGAESENVQVTVFISRKAGAGLEYRDPTDPTNDSIYVLQPMPVKVDVDPTIGNLDELSIDVADERMFINDGYRIVDDRKGRIYRVLERYAPPEDEIILLDRNWDADSGSPVWVVPPPVSSGRGPCIAVYQKVIRF